jgi:hypothetical protein
VEHDFSSRPYLEAAACVCNPRTRHAVVTKDTLNVDSETDLSTRALEIGAGQTGNSDTVW